MDPDQYQQAWKAYATGTRVTIDPDVLLREVQRSQGSFEKMIFWRDLREAGTSILLIPIWLILGFTLSLPWTWYLAILAFIWVSAFMLVDRKLQNRKLSEKVEPLLSSVNESVKQVEHQIWLLRNVIWWYLLPFAVPLLIFFAHVAWTTTQSWPAAVVFATPLGIFVLALYAVIYFINQYAVRTQLEPRRQELLRLRAALGDEPTGEISGEYPILMNPENEAKAGCRRLLLAGVLFVVFLSIGLGIFYLGSQMDEGDGYPKLSPYSAVRWQEFQPEVKIGPSWLKLISIDGVPANEIVNFCRETYGAVWRKRFEEDLVEVLSVMGHPPGESVDLVLEFPATSSIMVFEDMLMTRANRQAIWDANQERERLQGTRNGEPVEKLKPDALPLPDE